jgi:hypothetical protein
VSEQDTTIWMEPRRKYTWFGDRSPMARRSARGNGNAGKAKTKRPKVTPPPNHPTLHVEGLTGKRRWVRGEG